MEADAITFRTTILNGLLKKKTIQEIDRELCETYGKDAVNYIELEYWYYQFLKGNRDVEYDRSQDPKPKELINLPGEVIKEVMDKLGAADRVPFRCVCKRLRFLADTLTLGMKKLWFRVYFLWVTINIDDAEITYWDRKSDGCQVETGSTEFNLKGNFIEVALDDLKFFLMEAKVDQFKIQITHVQDRWGYRKASWEYGPLLKLLGTFEDQLCVKELILDGLEMRDMHSFLQFFKPGVLTKFTMDPREKAEDQSLQLKKLAKLDQWKQLTCVGMRFGAGSATRDLITPVECFSHLSEVWVLDNLYHAFDPSVISNAVKSLPNVNKFGLYNSLGFLHGLSTQPGSYHYPPERVMQNRNARSKWFDIATGQTFDLSLGFVDTRDVFVIFEKRV